MFWNSGLVSSMARSMARLALIEGPERIKREFPLHEAGMEVVWTSDMGPYRTRKVRILNGAHTMTVLGAYLAGKDTVKECMDDPLIAGYMKSTIAREIIPVLTLPEEELRLFADEVLQRFANPFIRHYLLSIALNSAAKYKARVLPTIIDYFHRFGSPPEGLSWSLAAFIAFSLQTPHSSRDRGEIQGRPAGGLDGSSRLGRIGRKAPQGNT